MTKPHSYFRPDSLQALADTMREHPKHKLVAGGTDVFPLLNYGLIAPEVFISLSNIRGLNVIQEDSEGLSIGSMVTLNQLASYARQKPEYSALAAAAERVASPQIRTVGTVGGNLLQEKRCFYFNQTADWRRGIEPCFMTGGSVCHQMPAKPYCCAVYYSDLAPVLIACGAYADIFKDEKTISHPIADIAGGFPAGGILIKVNLPKLETGKDFIFFHKLAVRGGIDFPLSNAALSVRGGKVRLVLGAMAGTPIMLETAASQIEEYMKQNKHFDSALYEAAEAEAVKMIRPVRETAVTPVVKKNAVRVLRKVMQDFDNRI